MTLLDLTRYELTWRLREPFISCFILSPIVILILTEFGLIQKRLVAFYEYYCTPPEAFFLSIMQIASAMWLVFIVLVLAKNYGDRIVFLCLPASRMLQWTAKVISMLVISAMYFINLALVIYLTSIVAAKEIVICPLHMLLTSLSSGGVLMIFLALSAYVRNRFLFVVLSLFVIVAPTLVKFFSEYFIGNFMMLKFVNCGNIPDSVAFFFKYCLPVYYLLSFFIGYFGYLKMKTGHEV